MKAMLLLVLAAAILFGEHHAPWAFDGELDKKNKFPFVVRLLTPGAVCTGFVISRRMVLTAGHCIYRDNAYVDWAVVEYWDEVNFKDRRVDARHLWVTNGYLDISPYYDQYVALSDEDKQAHYTPKEQYALFWEATVEDIGIIITDADIWVSAYPLMVLNINHDFADSLWGPAPYPEWSKEVVASIDHFLEYEVLDSPHSAVGVGYGFYVCDEDIRNESCKGDLQRRWGSLDVISVEDIHGFYDPAGLIIARPSTDAHAGSPLFGDSGSGLIVQKPGGNEWVIVGVVSKVDKEKNAYYAPLFRHMHVLSSVVTSPEYQNALTERGFIVAAATLWNGRVSVAWSKSAYREDAEQAAVNACASNGVPGCQVVETVRKGCLFITWGESDREIGWRVGNTSDEAYYACTSYGFSYCAVPIGTCLE